MKDWKIVLLNGVITAVILFAGIKWLVPDAPALDSGKIEKTLAIQMERLQTRLTSMEETLSKQTPPAAVISGQRREPDETLQKVEQKLDVLLGKLTFLQQKIDTFKPGPGFGNNIPAVPGGERQPFSGGGGQGRLDWLENLSPERRNEVNMIFEEHTKRIREKLPAPTDGSPPDREAMRKVLQESKEELRETMREVLSDEEYQQFISSLPKRRPVMPGNGRPEQGLGGLR